MAQISKYLRSVEGGLLTYYCQGCEGAHTVRVDSTVHPVWGYNGNPDAPTFTPSVLTTGREFTEEGQKMYDEWYAAGFPNLDNKEFPSRDTVCHTFITDGMVQFLGDCTHKYVNQTVPMAELPDWMKD